MNRICLAAFTVAAVIVGSGCDSTRHAATTQSTPPPESIVRVVFDPAVPSRDGDRIAVVRHVGSASYLEVGPANRRHLRTVYTARDSCCGDLAWAARWLVVFDNDYRVLTLDVRSGRLRQIAGFSDFQLSKDGRWAAGWARAPMTPKPLGSSRSRARAAASCRGRATPPTPTRSSRRTGNASSSCASRSSRARAAPGPATRSACRCRACVLRGPAEPRVPPGALRAAGAGGQHSGMTLDAASRMSPAVASFVRDQFITQT
jgi:hypothetical protein